MWIRSQSYRRQKAGNSEDEYEDACWPEGTAEWCGESFRCAVADGATETSFSGLWARLLVEAWGRHELRDRSWAAHLPALGHAWRDAVGSRPLPWYAEEKVRSGAYASLLGVSLTRRRDEASGGWWRALAVGDTCLFHVSRDRLQRAFPLQTSEQFDNRPHLVSSNAVANTEIGSHVRRAGGRWLPGDTLLCMTDALAQWFLRAAEGSEKPWNTVQALAEMGCQQGFEEWIATLRDRRLLRNDDVTLLAVSLLGETV